VVAVVGYIRQLGIEKGSDIGEERKKKRQPSLGYKRNPPFHLLATPAASSPL
jgi:hypothetical protein